MADDKENSSEASRQLAEASLPDEGNLAAVGELSSRMKGATYQAFADELLASGLLKDFAPLFRHDSRSPKAIEEKRIADLGEFIERFELLASEMCDRSGTPQAAFEIRLRDCRIEKADLSSMDIRFPLHLEHCQFTGPAKFVGTHFHRKARFVGAEFLGNANFFASSFDDEAVFSGATFDGPADYRGATFAREVSFFRANFKESLELKFAKFEREASLNLLELRFRGSSVLAGGLLLSSDQLLQGRWPRQKGLITGEHSTDIHSLASACEQYGELEANFRAQGSPDSAAAQNWCHYRYMDLRRRTVFGRRDPRRMLDWLFMKWCFGYGVFTRRILVTGLVMIILFGILYATNFFGLGDDVWAIAGPNGRTLSGPWYERLATSLYLSAITFSTVGYGDWHPLHWARLAAAVEGLLGIFIMAVFTVSFARKIIR